MPIAGMPKEYTCWYADSFCSWIAQLIISGAAPAIIVYEIDDKSFALQLIIVYLQKSGLEDRKQISPIVASLNENSALFHPR